jgi:hypothetical protein
MVYGQFGRYRLKYVTIVAVAASFLMSCDSGTQGTVSIIDPPLAVPDSPSSESTANTPPAENNTPSTPQPSPDSTPVTNPPSTTTTNPANESVQAPDTSDRLLQGVFFDSPVANLRYSTTSHSGVTNDSGQFSYRDGESIVFSIGNINLPAVTATDIITPIDLFVDGAVNHRGVVNVSRLLQSLDDDGNPDNGITLSPAADSIAINDALSFESTEFSSRIIPVLASIDNSRTLVSASDAMQHLADSLSSAGLPAPLLDANQTLLDDTDQNGIPDEFDWDDDGDGVADGYDQFPYDSTEQFDFDGDGIGNNADRDDDNDGIEDSMDAFVFASSESADFDNDGIGDNADVDDDNDGVHDLADAFPRNASEQIDTDGDGIGNRADDDDDNDGHPDTLDVFPYTASEYADNDGDGIGDTSDEDDDNDGVRDLIDAFPFDPAEYRNSDSDGLGDNTDTDDDGDGIPDDIDNETVTTTSNSPPVITAPESVTVSDTGVSTMVSITAADPENNAVRISWSITESPVDGILIVRPTSDFTQAALSSPIAGNYEVTVQATDGITDAYKTISVEVKNSAPIVPVVSISPTDPGGSDDLYAVHDPITDPDNDTLSITYRWAINDSELIETRSPVLSYGSYKRGDSVKLQIHVSDGTHAVTQQTADSVEIGNAAPSARHIEITPTDAGTNDELFISITDLVDHDGDNVDLTYQWLLNGEILNAHTGSSLPAGIAKHPDTVSAKVTLDDGIEQVAMDEVSLSLTNTPASLNTDSVPALLNYRQETSFSIRYVDPDGTEVTTTLVDAPDGLTYNADTGLVTWTPTPFMLSQTERYFAVFKSSFAQIESIPLTVFDENRQPPLARSGIAVPSTDYELDIGDFDNDGTTEVLSTDSYHRIFTLELDGQSVIQDWLYPFAVQPGETIKRVWAHGDLDAEIIAVTSKGISYIPSKTEVPVRVVDLPNEVSSAAHGDIDNDGVIEIVVVDERKEWHVVQTDTWEVTNLTIDLQEPDSFYNDYAFVLGDIDDDSTLEIVVNTGSVVDPVSGLVEWQHTSAFGSRIAIGDVNGDGDTDIVASDRWDNVTSYDPVAQASMWVYDINDFCSLRLYNVDDDPQDELIAGPCQHGAVEIYDGASGTMVLQQEIDDPAYNSGLRSFSMGDLDADGIDELVFSTGTNTSAEDNMVVISLDGLGDTSPGVAVNLNPSTIKSFDIAGWDTTTTGQDTAVFVLPDTEGGDDGQRIALLTDSGELSISEVTASNWSDSSAATVVDNDGDGVVEILVSAGNYYNGELHHIALDDFSLLHLHKELGSTDTYSNPEIVSVESAIAGDGSTKAILATSKQKIQVYDIASMQADWTSSGLSVGRMIGAIAIDNGNGFDIAVAAGSELTLWKPADTGYNKIYTASAECKFLTSIVINNAINIACIESNHWGENTKLTLFNTSLIKQSEVSLGYEVTAVQSNGGQILMGTTKELDIYSRVDQTNLVLINPTTGLTLWESAPLVGQITGIELLHSSSSGTTRIGLSTNRAMYISR